MSPKFMEIDAVKNTVSRMDGCIALLNSLAENAGISAISEDALMGLADLLECIRGDLEADIHAAIGKQAHEAAEEER